MRKRKDKFFHGMDCICRVCTRWRLRPPTKMAGTQTDPIEIYNAPPTLESRPSTSSDHDERLFDSAPTEVDPEEERIFPDYPDTLIYVD